MILHELKTYHPFFDDIFYNRKDFEVRINDRNYQVGDRLKLVNYPNVGRQKYVLKDIKYILECGQFGIKEGYVVLGLKEIPNAGTVPEAIKEMELDKLVAVVRKAVKY